MRFTFGNPNHWRMCSGWQEMLNVKNMAMDTRRTTHNIYRENNFPYSKPPQQLEEIKKKVYALIAKKSTVRDISVVRINNST